ncbi:MAG: hypothetical protein Q9175_003583 [Cornicularia normoerica]
MLRPATPLTILFFVAFVLLLLSTISTPIVKGIPLASYNGVTYGVLGYCGSSGCSKVQIGYSNPNNDKSNFSLPSNTRHDLSSILIVHPIAAVLTLICFILAATSHLHSPSHSPRYLLGLIILSIPTLLITLLAFLVDILLFIPHLAWGGWIVLAATILILASGIITCAMRRTLVSRKARTKRIAENAEMSGENFYARQAAPPVMAMPRAESPPPLTNQLAMSGGLDDNKLPAFATFETKHAGDEDRIPLNTRTPSNKTVPSVPSSGGQAYSDDGFNRYGGPGRGGPNGMRGGRGGRYNGPRDEHGNPLPSSNAFGPMPPAGRRRDMSEPPMRRQYSDETMNSQSSRSRGRGGYAPRGYGRGGPYGPGRGGPYGPSRGGYGPGRGGYGPGNGRGGILMGAMAAGAGAGMMADEHGRWQGPPPGYANGYPPEGRPGQYDGYGGPAGYGRSPSAPGYGRRPSPGPPSAPGRYGGQSPGPPSAPGGYRGGPSPGGYGRGPSPPQQTIPGGYGGDPLPGGDYAYARQEAPPGQQPIQPYRNEPSPPLPLQHPGDGEIIGQAIEMDARTGSPGLASPQFPRTQQLRDSDSEVQGLVGIQKQGVNKEHRDSPISLTSVYSGEQPYVPPRSTWVGVTRGVTPTPNTTALDPIELPTSNQNTMRRPRTSSLPQAHAPGHGRNQSSADAYYEDVDPRFVAPIADTARQTQATESSGAVPSSLMPGISQAPSDLRQAQHPTIETIDPSSSYEELQDGQMSPASDMTSISQRGVNPDWRPGMEATGGQRSRQANLDVPGRREQKHQQQQRDILLSSNPDFELPSGSGPHGRIPAGVGGQQGQAF